MGLLKKPLFGLVVSLALVMSSVSASPVFVDFEGATDGSYAASTINLSSLDRQIGPQALIGTLAGDIKNGLRAARMRLDSGIYGSLTMLGNKMGGIGVVNFLSSRADFVGDRTGVAPLFELQYSTESPRDIWTTVGTVDLSDIDSLTPYSFEVNYTGDTGRIRFVQVGGDTGKRRNIDDIWIGSAYEIIYSGNNQTSGTLPPSQIKLYSTGSILSDNTGGLERTGYTFVGWNTQADGSETPYTTGSLYTNEDNIIFYPQWQINQYIVTFQDRDTSFLSSGYVSYGDSAIPPTNPSRTGYTFSGWNRDLSTITGDIIISGEYNINSYTITYEGGGADGGTAPTIQTGDYNTNIILSINTFTRDGYVFSGWGCGAEASNYLIIEDAICTAQRNKRATIVVIPSTPGPVNTNFTIDIVFSTGVNGFTTDDITLSTNANKGGFSTITATTHYRLVINPINDGDITITIEDDAAQDIALNNNIVGIIDYIIVLADLTAPIITINNPDTDPSQTKTITAATNEGSLFQSIVTTPTCNGTLSFVPYASTTLNLENDNGKYICYRAIDLAGNITYTLSNPITGIDTTAPLVSEFTPINTPTNNTTPSYTFTTNESGTITYGGACTSLTSTAMSGQNTIIFEPLNGDASATGNLYDACTLTVTDIAGNISLILNITPFVVDTVVPTAAVTYTTTTRTNQDVIVTLSGYSEPISISNNSGNNTYTFVENGTFTFEFVDQAGNTGSTIATVNIIDKIPPVITINGSNPLNVYKGSSYSDLGAKRSDNISGTGDLIGSGTIDTSVLGNYIVTYTITDEAGNITISQRTVVVINLPSAGGIGGSSGGGSSFPSIDYCPEGDFSKSYYDGTCGTQQEEEVIIPNKPETTINQPQLSEQETAYERAYRYNITTLYPIENAFLDKTITRAELAKMVSVYATTILNKEKSITNPGCASFTDRNEVNSELAGFMIQSCQLGIMGLQADGQTPLKEFRPNDTVTRAQFVTVLSRILYGDTYNNDNDEGFRTEHMTILKSNNILTTMNPDLIELRGWIILMFYRTSL